MKNLIELIAKALVDKPEEVRVNEVEGEGLSVIELKVAKEDIGKIIGKNGVRIKAIRSFLRAAGGKKNKRFNLEIIE